MWEPIYTKTDVENVLKVFLLDHISAIIADYATFKYMKLSIGNIYHVFVPFIEDKNYTFYSSMIRERGPFGGVLPYHNPLSEKMIAPPYHDNKDFHRFYHTTSTIGTSTVYSDDEIDLKCGRLLSVDVKAIHIMYWTIVVKVKKGNAIYVWRWETGRGKTEVYKKITIFYLR
jgi:hypothetical protein